MQKINIKYMFNCNVIRAGENASYIEDFPKNVVAFSENT